MDVFISLTWQVFDQMTLDSTFSKSCSRTLEEDSDCCGGWVHICQSGRSAVSLAKIQNEVKQNSGENLHKPKKKKTFLDSLFYLCNLLILTKFHLFKNDLQHWSQWTIQF